MVVLATTALALVPTGLVPAAAGPAASSGTPPAAAGPVREPTDGDIAPVHDPDIAVEDGVRYLYSTGPGLPIRRSTDGVTWERVGQVFAGDGLPEWAQDEVPGAIDPWAPDLEWFGGQWHLYYAISRFAETDSAIGHATSPTLDVDDPDYGWTDHGPVVTSEAVPVGVEPEWNAIDPNAAVDGDRVWLAWGSFGGGIKLRELDPVTGAPAPSAATETLARRELWFTGVEAAHLVERDGSWYLFTSWYLCCRGVDSNYEVRVGRADSIEGPYLDRDGVPLAAGGGTLVLTGYGDVRGPGHSSMLVADDTWTLVHHFYDGAAAGVPTLGLHRLTWTADGWPEVPGMPAWTSGTTTTTPAVTTPPSTGQPPTSASTTTVAVAAPATPRFAG